MITRNKPMFNFWESAMVVCSFFGIAMVALTLTDFGKTKGFSLVLGVVALVTAAVCVIEARLYEPSTSPRATIKLDDLALAGILLWLVIAVLSFADAAGFPLLRQP